MKEQEFKGLRFNSGKTRHDLLPTFAQEQYAKVMTIGATKYKERNWEAGMAWSTVLASLERHIQAFKSGEDYDLESGELHMAHAMCNVAFLLEYYKIFPQGDDRPHKYLNYPKIGLDIDEVLARWTPAWCRKWDIPTPMSWYFDREISSKFEVMRQHGELDEFYLSLEVLTPPDEIPFEPHCYITSRPVNSDISMQWLDKNGYPHRPVYTVGLGQSKVDVIHESGCEIFVDDRFENFVELNRAGVCCFLFDAPHNKKYNVGYKRIKSLKELV